MKSRIKKIAMLLVFVAAVVWLLALNAGPVPDRYEYGVTFSKPYAVNLGLDWKKVYVGMLDELGVKLIRIPVYWNDVQPQDGTFNFDDYDFMLQQAKVNGARVILAIGKRLPRWPECHVPEWVLKLSETSQQSAQLSYIENVVRRYQDDETVDMWQVENEPFLGSFGPCPDLDVEFFDKEVAFVKELDPAKPILITDSGELSLWLQAGKRGDAFGTTYYRYVYSDVLKRYWTNFYFPGWQYRAKAGLVRLLYGKKQILVAELEAEPWTTKGIVNTSIEEQFKTMNLDKFRTITKLARQTKFSPQILWGVEWWYWMRGQGHEEFWEEAKKLMQGG